MTLKEAYEIRRKEVLSLQAENKKLKKQLADGTFSSKEKEDLERHIRHLEQVIQTTEKRCRTLRESCDISDRIRHDLQMQIMDLTETISSLRKENEVLTKRALIPPFPPQRFRFEKRYPTAESPPGKSPVGSRDTAHIRQPP